MSTYAVVNPATGETLATYPTMTDAEATAAIAAADDAYRTWGRTSAPAERAELVRPQQGRVADDGPQLVDARVEIALRRGNATHAPTPPTSAQARALRQLVKSHRSL